MENWLQFQLQFMDQEGLVYICLEESHGLSGTALSATQ